MAERTKTGLSADDVAKALGVKLPDVCAWARQGCPRLTGRGSGRGYRFESLEAVEAWRDSDERCAEVLEPSPAGLRFRRQGWLGGIRGCFHCAEAPLGSANERRLGEHVVVEPPRGRRESATVRCSCSARLGRATRAQVPPKDWAKLMARAS